MEEVLVAPIEGVDSLPLVHALFQGAEERPLLKFSYRPHDVHAMTFESQKLGLWLAAHKDNIRWLGPGPTKHPLRTRTYESNLCSYAALRHDGLVYLLESPAGWPHVVHCYCAPTARPIWETVFRRTQPAIARLSSLRQSCLRTLQDFDGFKADATALVASAPYLGVESLKETLVKDLISLTHGNEDLSDEADKTFAGFAQSTDFPKSLYLNYFGDEGDTEFPLPQGVHRLKGAEHEVLYVGLADGQNVQALLAGPGRVYEFTEAMPLRNYEQTALCNLGFVEAWNSIGDAGFESFRARLQTTRQLVQAELEQAEADLLSPAATSKCSTRGRVKMLHP